MAHWSKVHRGAENDRRHSRSVVDRPPVFHFFKIILSTTLEENKLRIPYKFVKKFGDELEHFVDLIVPNGRVWKVGLSKAQHTIWFDDGWQKFTEHYSIRHGHFLVFAYTGFCSFNVLIFDTSASEIEYPRNDQSHSYEENCIIGNEVEMQDDIPSEVFNSIISSPSSSSFKSELPDASATKRNSSETHTKSEKKLPMKRSTGATCMVSPDFDHVGTRNKRLKVEQEVEIIDIDDHDSRRKKLGKHKIPDFHDSLTTKRERRTKCRSGEIQWLAECEGKDTEIITSNRFQGLKATPKSERAMAAAMMYKPKTPSFMILLRAYNHHTKRVYVPNRFSSRYLNEALQSIKLRVSDGREWVVQLCRDGCSRVDIGVGWNQFYKDNNLNKGDVCVFELTNSKEVLKVSIFYAIEDD